MTRQTMGLLLLSAIMMGSAPLHIDSTPIIVTDLGVLEPLDDRAEARAINEYGQVVGSSSNSPTLYFSKAFLWDSGVFHKINDALICKTRFQHATSVGWGINNLGHVSGTVVNVGSFFRVPFVWTPESGVSVFNATTNSDAIALNDSGLAVIKESGSSPRAILWDSVAETSRDLGHLGGGSAQSLDINRWGEVVGTSKDAQHNDRAFIWTPESGMKDLGPGTAIGINDRGMVVGRGANNEAFLWDRFSIISLGKLPTATFSDALDMNNLGLIVGRSNTGPSDNDDDTTTRAVIWLEQQRIDLNELLPAGSPWILNEATGVNDNGDIVGIARLSIDGKPHAVLISNVYDAL